MEQTQLQEKFKEIFGHDAQHIFFSPGRVNLIGEHIDYNGGLVMPCAITFGTYLLISQNDSGQFRFRSINFNDKADVSVGIDYKKEKEHWYNYPLGVIKLLTDNGLKLSGCDMLFYGDIPIGSGLSSSASIEIVAAFALNEIFSGGFNKLELVKFCKSVENDFIGVSSGIMDQFAVAFGKKDKALKLDCATLAYEAVNCDLGQYVLAIINTNKPRKLAESKYNERVAECQSALKDLKPAITIDNLCEIDSTTFKQYENLIKNETVRKRAKHVVEENERVQLAASALFKGNLTEFGSLMYASHKSLQHLYEVSGAELDTIVDYCRTNADVAGARMTGAGFGGCAIALVKKDDIKKFSNEIISYYNDKIGYSPSVYISNIGDGVRRLQ